jgi:toxin ParE1/3/4
LSKARWRIRLGAAAERDFVRILQWTQKTFGKRQAAAYRTTLLDALSALEDGPNIPGSRAREEILPGLRTFHVARAGRRGRHFIMYRAGDDQVVEVLRILHDAMDLSAHASTKSE